MLHLHNEGVVHGDLKAPNILLKLGTSTTVAASDVDSAAAAAAGACGGGVCDGNVMCKECLIAKVADFGLATRLGPTDTHVSGVHRVRCRPGRQTARQYALAPQSLHHCPVVVCSKCDMSHPCTLSQLGKNSS